MNKPLEITKIVFLALLIIAIYYSLQTNQKDQSNVILKELKIKDSLKTLEYNQLKDSLKSIYIEIDNKIQTTNKSINKILKNINEKVKQIPHLTDSAKFYIADSILRANGFR